MRFGILGPLEVISDGVRVRLGGPRQRAVLARLILDAGRVVATDALIEDVWGGRPPTTATKTLQKYVSELRKALGRPVLRTRPGGYLLDIPADAIDAVQFERLVADGEFEDALALWRGDVLVDLPDSRFAASEIGRLCETRLLATEGRLAAGLDAGRHAAAVAELSEMVDEHPLRERLTELLMLALYRSGRHVEALRVYERHRRRLADEIGVDPAPPLRDLQRAILHHDAALDVNCPVGRDLDLSAGNLPALLTSFIGRADELASVARAVTVHRLVTLTGPGGVGKTRLALEASGLVGAGMAGGVWLVDLAAVSSPELVPRAVATTVGVAEQPGQEAVDTLAAVLARRPPTLLLLDNCEHVAAASAALVERVLDACPETRVLATSRCSLGVDGEVIRPVGPLTDDDAVQLFTERAARVTREVDAAEQADAARQICRDLDGLPLAIELAASQLRVLEPCEIAARLGDRLRILARPRARAARQRTLHDMVAWSYALLTPPARRTFARLGVFPASFTLEAAEAVCAGDGAATGDVLDHIRALVDHSLVVRERAPGGTSRYRLLETLRLFALERLAERGDEERARRAHALFFRDFAAVAGPQLHGPDERAWRRRLDVEEPNIHGALRWGHERDPSVALELGVALWPYWDARWLERQAVPYLESLLSRPDLDCSPRLRAWALTAAAELAANPGEVRQATAWSEQAAALFRELGDELGLAHALLALASAVGNQGALDRADRASEEGLALARRFDEPVLIARLLATASFVAFRRGDHERALELTRDELAQYVDIGSRRGEGTALRHLAVACQHLGRLDEASELCARALAIWIADDDPTAAAHVRVTLGDIARLRGDPDEASRRYGEALEELRAVGDRRCTASTFKNLGLLAARRGDHQRARQLFADALVLRHELGDEGGLAECLEGLAVSLAADDRFDQAMVLLGAAEARRIGARPPSPEESNAIADAVAGALASLGVDASSSARQRGFALSTPVVIDHVIGACIVPG